MSQYSLPILLLLLLIPSLSDVPSPTPVTPTAACSSTTDPAFCQSVLPPRGSHNIYTYTRLSLAKSLHNARKFLRTVDRYLLRRSALSGTAVGALEDCRLLAELNIDFLVSAVSAVNSTSAPLLLDPETDELQTLLSALLTNQQTCSDGLQAAASVKNGLSAPLWNGTKLYSVSLALFNRAWASGKKTKKFHNVSVSVSPENRIPRGRRLLLFHEVLDVGCGGGLPIEISSEAGRDVFERRGRRLLQSSGRDAAVRVGNVVEVRQDGTGNFTNITDAVSSAPSNGDGSKGYFLIVVGAGVYQEYVSIPKNKKYVMMVGDGIGETIVTGDRNNADGWTTFNSATFAVGGLGFVALNMTFRNTAGPAKHQAVAVRNGADLSTFYRCSFEGYQDTLYTHSMRQFYKNCDIYGTVDYIFGNAAVIFQECNMYSRLPMRGQSNVITAQGRTDPNQNTGTSIHDCYLGAAPELAADVGGATRTYLGRPWKEYSRTVVMQSSMGGLIDATGWMPWNGDFALSTLYYAEFNNSGPGSDTGGRVAWSGFHVISNGTEALNYTVTSFVLGDYWLPQTGVPYSSGLL